MLLRISLVITILAGLAALYFSHIPVQEKINTITTQRDDATKQASEQSAAAAKAKSEAKKAGEEAAKASKDLEEKNLALDETAKKLAEQQKRANQLFEDITVVTKERNEAQQEYAPYKILNIKPDQIASLRDQVTTVTTERDAVIAESQVLLRNNNRLRAELDSLVGRNIDVVLPAGLKGKILAYDPKFDFVVLDIGGNQGVLENGKLLVNRNGKFVAKVQITRVEPNRSIANIIPEWKQTEIMEGDQVLY
jgi:Skp family chaperone for outer membrane proteins